MSKTDTTNHEMDDSSNKVSKLEARIIDLTNERDDLVRQRKEKEAKMQEINRKWKMEKESAEALR